MKLFSDGSPPPTTSTFRAAARAGSRILLDQRNALLRLHGLNVRPPFGDRRIRFSGRRSQQQKVVRSTKTRMFEKSECAAAIAPFEAWLHCDQLGHWYGEAFWYGNATLLLRDDAIARH